MKHLSNWLSVGLLCTAAAAASLPRATDELRFCLHGAPKTLDPYLASDSSAEAIRYLTHGVLVRVDRKNQRLVPELAVTWRSSSDRRRIEFDLRPGVRFSDGTPLKVSDVLYTINHMLSPDLHSPAADAFRQGEARISVSQKGANTVVVTFPTPRAEIAALFDNVPILAEKSPSAGLGPWTVAHYKAGAEIVLERNPNYWKRDESGKPLPYVSTLRISIQTNRDMELASFERGELDMIPELSAALVQRVESTRPAGLVNLGTTLDSLVLWFNQTNNASLPAHKQKWFQSTAFRKALSLAINRDDITRIAFSGRARPAIGPVSPANRAWLNTALHPDPHAPAKAIEMLQAAGFTLKNGSLFDVTGHAVEFSTVTNSGNKVHERTLAIMEQDWKRIGIKLNIVVLDFPALIERITRTYNYESCLLPLTNVGIDPNEQMNVWTSSGANHQWNPSQSSPATAWEAEIDALMTKQNTSDDPAIRKKAFDRVQQIATEQCAFIYIAHPSASAATSDRVKLAGASIWPYALWDLERARLLR